MTNPDREELVKLDEAGLEAAVRECARITAPEIPDDEYERIKTDNSPRYQNTRTEMARAIRAYLRAAKPALSSIVTCCVTGAIPGDGGACGDCDPCLLGEASVPAPVKTLIAEKNSLIHRVGELEDELDSLRRLASSDSGVKGEPVADWRDDPTSDERWNAGCDFAMEQLCKALNVDPETVNWDAATETVDGDVQSVIWNILRTRMGENWGPDTAQPADAGMREALEDAEGIFEQIRLILINNLDEPVRSAFWKAVEGREKCRAALTAPGATTKSDGDAESKLVAPALEKHSTTFDREVCQTASRPSEQSGQVQSAMQNPEAGVAPRPSDANSGNAVELFERHTGLKLKITDATRSDVTCPHGMPSSRRCSDCNGY